MKFLDIQPFPYPPNDKDIEKEMKEYNIKPSDFKILLDTSVDTSVDTSLDALPKKRFKVENNKEKDLEHIKFYRKIDRDTYYIIIGITVDNMPTIIFFKSLKFFEPIKYKECKISLKKQAYILDLYKSMNIDINNDDHLKDFLNNFIEHCLKKIS